MSNKFIWRVPTLLLSPAEVPTAWSTGEDDFKSFFPTSSSGKEFSASVVLKQIFKFHGWNFLMCYYFQEHHGQPEGVSSFRWRLVVFSPEKKKKQPKQKLQWCSTGSFLHQISSIDLEVPGFRDLDSFSDPWVCRLHKSQSQKQSFDSARDFS